MNFDCVSITLCFSTRNNFFAVSLFALSIFQSLFAGSLVRLLSIEHWNIQHCRIVKFNASDLSGVTDSSKASEKVSLTSSKAPSRTVITTFVQNSKKTQPLLGESESKEFVECAPLFRVVGVLFRLSKESLLVIINVFPI